MKTKRDLIWDSMGKLVWHNQYGVGRLVFREHLIGPAEAVTIKWITPLIVTGRFWPRPSELFDDEIDELELVKE